MLHFLWMGPGMQAERLKRPSDSVNNAFIHHLSTAAWEIDPEDGTESYRKLHAAERFPLAKVRLFSEVVDVIGEDIVAGLGPVAAADGAQAGAGAGAAVGHDSGGGGSCEGAFDDFRSRLASVLVIKSPLSCLSTDVSCSLPLKVLSDGGALVDSVGDGLGEHDRVKANTEFYRRAQVLMLIMRSDNIAKNLGHVEVYARAVAQWIAFGHGQEEGASLICVSNVFPDRLGMKFSDKRSGFKKCVYMGPRFFRGGGVEFWCQRRCMTRALCVCGACACFRGSFRVRFRCRCTRVRMFGFGQRPAFSAST